MCFHYNTDSWVDVTSVTFKSKNEDNIFDRQGILQFFLEVSKDYKHEIGTLIVEEVSKTIEIINSRMYLYKALVQTIEIINSRDVSVYDRLIAVC